MLFVAGNTKKALCSAATLAVLDALDAITSRCRRPKINALAKRSRKLTQVEKLGLLATPFGQALRALALT